MNALRSLRTTPVPVIAAILTLALAAGANLAMLGLIDRALLSPPPGIAAADRLFTVGFEVPSQRGSGRMTTTSYVTFAALRDDVPAVDGAAAFQRVSTTLMLDGEQRSINAMIVSGEYFDVVGAAALLGRPLGEEDDRAGAARPAAVVSHAFWRSALRGDANVLGRRIVVRSLDYVVTGVMPEGFSGHSTLAVDLWLPFAAAMRTTPGWERETNRNFLSILSRLDASANQAAAETQASAVSGRTVSLRGVVGADVAANEQQVAWWLGGVSILVLVIGLVNTAILVLVRAARMRYDVAVRAALGASRSRLVGQAMLEAALIAGGATVVSVLLASWLDEAVRRVLFPAVVSRTVISTTAVVTALVAGVLGFAVAALASASQIPARAQAIDLAGGVAGGARRTRTMTAALLLQTTMSVVLLAGAGMFGGSLYRLWAQDFGMQMDNVLVVDMEAGPDRVADADELFINALAHIRALPGVDRATTIDAIPFSGFSVPPIAVPGRPEPPAVGRQLPYLIAATPEFLEILGIELIEGRMLTAADDRGAPVVLVNQAMAQGVWPGESAVGKCIRIGFNPDFVPGSAEPVTPSEAVTCREVVGVVRDVRQRSVLPFDNEDRLMQYFVPPSQVPFPPFIPDPMRARGLLLRVSGDVRALAPVIRRAVVGDRTDVPFVRVRPYAELLERQMRPWRMGTTLLALFSALALAVASVGLYAAFAHAVGERRREMAIRVAVGARPAGILRMILRESLTLAATGSIAGCLAAVFAGRWLESLLFGTQPSDPLVLGGAALAMLVVAVLATIRPARTAATADPAALLKVQ